MSDNTNIENTVTMQDVDNCYQKWVDYLNNGYAEQHQLRTIFRHGIIIERYYNDLKKNWDIDHAKLFINTLEKKVFPAFGINLQAKKA